MAVKRLHIERFRCLEAVEFTPDSRRNVIVGLNGAGKTSILEALFFLGRGRSFRSGGNSALIRDGAEDFLLFGELGGRGAPRRLGIQVGRGGMRIHVDGEAGGTVADLAAGFPVQVIEPEIHELVQGGPEGRRRFLDWGVFHVKHAFYPAWRRYRRALQQRNGALRQGAPRAIAVAWDPEIVSAGQEIDALRREYLEALASEFSALSGRLIGQPAIARYRPGWPRDQSLEEALASSWERDARHGRTHVGPHRAELTLQADTSAVRNRMSRGQQKLIGIALILAQTAYVARQLESDVTLLVDEPAAELDSERLEMLLDLLLESPAQLFITALDREALPVDATTSAFHVERGKLTILI